MLNAAFGDQFILEFKVSLGHDWSKSKPAFFKSIAGGENWYMSRKLDGVRVVVICEKGGATRCYSREGRELPALKKLSDLLGTQRKLGGCVLDGEVCVIDPDGKESFKEAVSQVKRSTVMESLAYCVFDVLTLEEFRKGESTDIFSKRLARHDKLFDGLPLDDFREHGVDIRFLEQQVYTPEKFRSMQDTVSDEKWEGIILRRDCLYQGKRSKDILKVKEFHTCEFQVKSTDTGKMRTMDKETGKEREEETMTAVKVEWKGHEVSVGSGFTVEQRRKFYKNPELIVGKIIEVQYFEETTDKDGKFSLRFPTVKMIWGQEKDL
jgi:DNA ligase-1